MSPPPGLPLHLVKTGEPGSSLPVLLPLITFWCCHLSWLFLRGSRPPPNNLCNPNASILRQCCQYPHSETQALTLDLKVPHDLTSDLCQTSQPVPTSSSLPAPPEEPFTPSPHSCHGSQRCPSPMPAGLSCSLPYEKHLQNPHSAIS